MNTIYIPNVNSKNKESYIKTIFEQHGIGQVNCVDFVRIRSNNRIKKAFVHVQEFYNTDIADLIRSALERNVPFHLYPHESQDKYWILKSRIRKLEERQADQIDRLQQAVLQLVGYMKFTDEEYYTFRNILMGDGTDRDMPPLSDEYDDMPPLSDEYDDMPPLIPTLIPVEPDFTISTDGEYEVLTA